MKRSILIILSIFLAVTVSAQDVSSALRQAQARFDSGNETGGIELVNKILAKYPDNKEAKDMLAKFNQVIKDREIEADWKIAESQNTFEAYQKYRTKHPSSKYDDTASDNMAKKLADRFTVNSTYADRTKAESYAKKAMTKDYIANKWKAVMAKKTLHNPQQTNHRQLTQTNHIIAHHLPIEHTVVVHHIRAIPVIGLQITPYHHFGTSMGLILELVP